MSKKQVVWDEYRLKQEGFIEVYATEIRAGDMVYSFDDRRSALKFLGTLSDMYALDDSQVTYKLIFRELDYANTYAEFYQKFWIQPADIKRVR